MAMTSDRGHRRRSRRHEPCSCRNARPVAGRPCQWWASSERPARGRRIARRLAGSAWSWPSTWRTPWTTAGRARRRACRRARRLGGGDRRAHDDVAEQHRARRRRTGRSARRRPPDVERERQHVGRPVLPRCSALSSVISSRVDEHQRQLAAAPPRRRARRGRAGTTGRGRRRPRSARRRTTTVTASAPTVRTRRLVHAAPRVPDCSSVLRS